MTETLEETMDTGLDAAGKKIDPENYFAVLCDMWNAKDEDHTIKVENKSGARRFRDWTDALDLYEKLEHSDFPGAGKADIRLELAHVRFGIPRVMKSRIVFPQ